MAETSENQEQQVAEASGDRRAELEGILAQKEEEISLQSTRIAELEQSLAESNGKLTEASTALAQAIANYRTLAVQSEPLAPADMIKGDSIETIDASLKSAREVISKVKAGLEAEGKVARVPAGAPQRRTFSLSALSPRDKIRSAIGGNK
ncbi:MAG: hypothetical protein HYX79_06060 [Chloroflexi bacterium]|nr:hypothetical protein [Chloroflexota bacterium]